MFVFGEKNVFCFLRMQVFLSKRDVKKVHFPQNAIITSGKNDIFEVRYRKNDNGDPRRSPTPPTLITFSDRGRENLQYREI